MALTVCQSPAGLKCQILTTSVIIAALQPVQAEYATVTGDEAQVKSLAAALRTKDPASAEMLDQADAQATKAIATYDTFVTALNAAPQAGTDPAVVRIVRGKKLQSYLANPNSFALLVIDQKIAEEYTKKNLWTFFGGPPLYTMGGITSVYILYDPNTGTALKAGVVPMHGGYRSVSDVENMFP